MNTKSFSTRLATLTLAAASVAVTVSAQDLRGNVPVSFTIGSKTFASGEYTISQMPNGVIALRDSKGSSAAFVMGVHTDRAGKKHVMKFDTGDGRTHRFAGYCVAGNTCWSTSESLRKPASSTGRIEIAMRSSQ